MINSEKYGENPSKYYEYKREKRQERKSQIKPTENSFLKRISQNSPSKYAFYQDKYDQNEQKSDNSKRIYDGPSYLLSTRITLKSLLAKENEKNSSRSRKSSVKKDPKEEIRVLTDSMFKQHESIHTMENEKQPTAMKQKRSRAAPIKLTSARAKNVFDDSVVNEPFEQIVASRKERSSSVKRAPKTSVEISKTNKEMKEENPKKRVVINEEPVKVGRQSKPLTKEAHRIEEKPEKKPKREKKVKNVEETKKNLSPKQEIKEFDTKDEDDAFVPKKKLSQKQGFKEFNVKDEGDFVVTKKNDTKPKKIENNQKIDPLSTIVDDLTLGLNSSSEKGEESVDYDEMIKNLLQESKAIEERANCVEKEMEEKNKKIKPKKQVVIEKEEEEKPFGVDTIISLSKKKRPVVSRETKKPEEIKEKKVVKKQEFAEEKDTKKRRAASVKIQNEKPVEEEQNEIEIKPIIEDNLDIHKPSVIPKNILDFISSMKETLNKDFMCETEPKKGEETKEISVKKENEKNVNDVATKKKISPKQKNTEIIKDKKVIQKDQPVAKKNQDAKKKKEEKVCVNKNEQKHVEKEETKVDTKQSLRTKEQREKFLEERKAADKKLLDEILLLCDEEEDEGDEFQSSIDSTFLELEKNAMNEKSSDAFVFSVGSSPTGSLLIEGASDEDMQ